MKYLLIILLLTSCVTRKEKSHREEYQDSTGRRIYIKQKN